MPANCVETGPEPSPTVFPDDGAKIAPVTIEPVEGKLGGADNRDDATKRKATFSVTVPAGQHIGTVAGCLGNGLVVVDTVPASAAYLQIDCNADPVQYSELVTEASKNQTDTVTYQVTVTSDAASRWDVAVFATSKLANTSQG